MRRVASWTSVLPALLFTACARWLPAPVPMRSVEWEQPVSQPRARCLIVFLPGLGDDAEDFEDRGFVAEVNRHRLSVDMVAAQATLGYYAGGTFPERLATDVVAPARARGYEQVWLVGMSMGGLGTVYYARAHTSDVTGLLALAPYLGDGELIDEIHAQGGLTRWRAPAKVTVLNEDNYQREIWRWLRAVTRGQEPGPAIYLGYGRSDKLAHADELLAASLPEGHTYIVDGAHDWKTWQALFGQFLDRSELARGCR